VFHSAPKKKKKGVTFCAPLQQKKKKKAPVATLPLLSSLRFSKRE
jgi:hypothetical protein